MSSLAKSSSAPAKTFLSSSEAALDVSPLFLVSIHLVKASFLTSLISPSNASVNLRSTLSRNLFAPIAIP